MFMRSPCFGTFRSETAGGKTRLLDEAVAQGLAHGLRLRVDVQFLVDAAYVVPDRIDADPESLCRGLIAVAVGEQPHEAHLLRSQWRRPPSQGPRAAQAFQDPARDLRWNGRPAAARLAHSLGDL